MTDILNALDLLEARREEATADTIGRDLATPDRRVVVPLLKEAMRLGFVNTAKRFDGVTVFALTEDGRAFLTDSLNASPAQRVRPCQTKTPSTGSRRA